MFLLKPVSVKSFLSVVTGNVFLLNLRKNLGIVFILSILTYHVHVTSSFRINISFVMLIQLRWRFWNVGLLCPPLLPAEVSRDNGIKSADSLFRLVNQTRQTNPPIHSDPEHICNQAEYSKPEGTASESAGDIHNRNTEHKKNNLVFVKVSFFFFHVNENKEISIKVWKEILKVRQQKLAKFYWSHSNIYCCQLSAQNGWRCTINILFQQNNILDVTAKIRVIVMSNRQRIQ